MDEFQKKLIEMKKQVPDCTASRQRLRSVMSDFFPGEKRRINAILNAYDEDIEVRLGNSSDKTLTALQLVKVLKDDYGLADDNAVEAVAAWCSLLGYEEIADAICIVTPSSKLGNSPIKTELAKTKEMSLGIYMAGYDFPAGDVKVEVISLSKDKQAQSQGVYYAILKKGSSSNSIIANGFIKSQAILSIKEGQRLEIGWQGDVLLTSLTEVS